MTWMKHVDEIHSRLKKYIPMLYKLRHIVSKHVLVKIYFSYIYPHIQYGIEIYPNTTLTALNKPNVLNNSLL